MEICSRFTGMERKNGAFLLHTDNANVKVCFVTDEIVRVRASFDHELAEEPYVLMTTAWEDWIKPLPDAALYRSTRIHHTPDSYTKTRTTLFLLCTKTCIVWRKIGVRRSFYWKSIKRKSLKLLGTSRSFRLCFAQIGNLLVDGLHRGDRSRKAHTGLYFPL